MACILIPPIANNKGVMSITTPEAKKYFADPRLIDEFIKVKQKYYVGLHHNWHPVEKQLDDIFDFHFLCARDLVVKHSNSPLIELDACNFTSKDFEAQSLEKIWDVLIVGRTGYFKRPFKALETIRRLMDSDLTITILYICPFTTELQDRNVQQELLNLYENMFSIEEKSRFVFLNPSANSPFPLSRKHLALFYRSSRVFVHFADTETRSRVAAYAFVAGLPVVGKACIGNILPKELSARPHFYEVADDDYVSEIQAALSNKFPTDLSGMRSILSEDMSLKTLVNSINKTCLPETEFDVNQFWRMNLDMRLGAHHFGIESSNTSKYSLDEFFEASLDVEMLEKQHEYLIIDSSPEEKIFSRRIKVDTDPLVNAALIENRKHEIRRSRSGAIRLKMGKIAVQLQEIRWVGKIISKIIGFILKVRK